MVYLLALVVLYNSQRGLWLIPDVILRDLILHFLNTMGVRMIDMLTNSHFRHPLCFFKGLPYYVCLFGAIKAPTTDIYIWTVGKLLSMRIWFRDRLRTPSSLST
jgi:hypothetical protein